MSKFLFGTITNLVFKINVGARSGTSYTIKPSYNIKAGISKKNMDLLEVHIGVLIDENSPFYLNLNGIFGFERGEGELSDVAVKCLKSAFLLLKQKVSLIMNVAGIKPYDLPEPDYSKAFENKNNLS